MRATKRGRGAKAGVPTAAARRPGSQNAITEIQRLRTLTAMATACRELGAGRVSVADVVSRAGVSRRTFYELFSDRADCIAAALEEGLRRAAEHVLPAYGQQAQWRVAVRAGVEAFLAFLDADRTFGRLLVIDSLAAGDAALARRAQVISVLVDEVHKGRHEPRAAKSATRSTAEGAVGGVLSILHARLLAKPERPLTPLAGELTGLIVLPYLGGAAAGREAARRLAPPRRLPQADVDVLADLDLRLTDRTLLVLRALAAQNGHGPGISNREVAESAGITDQGQVSKLLARLADRGLVTNTRRAQRHTASANAWRLTPKGAKVERATDPQAASVRASIVSSAGPTSPAGARRKPKG